MRVVRCAEIDNTSTEESMLLTKFSLNEQRRIVDDIISSYNLETKEGIRAALYQSAWLGFCAGIDSTKHV